MLTKAQISTIRAKDKSITVEWIQDIDRKWEEITQRLKSSGAALGKIDIVCEKRGE